MFVIIVEQVHLKKTNLDMIYHFTLDPMHLVHLGTTEKILLILTGDPQQGSIPSRKRRAENDTGTQLINRNFLGEDKVTEISNLLQSYFTAIFHLISSDKGAPFLILVIGKQQNADCLHCTRDQ